MVQKLIVLVGGYPGSGKSTYVKDMQAKGYYNINRDMYDRPGYVCSSETFYKHLEEEMKTGKNIVVDNDSCD